MSFQDLSQRLAALAQHFHTKEADGVVLGAVAAFCEKFGDLRPAAVFAAFDGCLDGPPLPESDGAILAGHAAAELAELAPMLAAWRAPKSTIALAEKLAARLSEHSEWSLRSIEILTLERLKYDGTLEEAAA